MGAELSDAQMLGASNKVGQVTDSYTESAIHDTQELVVTSFSLTNKVSKVLQLSRNNGEWKIIRESMGR